ncbi:MAG: hypothetical protein AABX98_06090 [Nanoarchaeota archaeon]
MEKRILFDTSVYGKLVLDVPFSSLLVQKKKNVEFVFYGNSIIRNELRATPKHITLINKSLRSYLLQTYDSLITKENHNLVVNIFVEQLSELYYKEYRNRDGNSGEASIKNDFIIVACASIYQMDIVVSDDKRTLLNDAALKAYEHVNKAQGFQNPKYFEYTKFREKVLTRCDI